MLPNFLIIGATKGGTTSLHYYLGQHPDVFVLPEKETNFFAQNSALCMIDRTVRSREEYEKLFAGAKGKKVIGESSPAYLAVPDAPKLIHDLIPAVKLIAVLRNPIERAYSHYLMRRRQGKEARTSFEEVLAADDLDPLRSYKSRGFYGQHLERYTKYFPMEQMKIFLYEEFTDDAAHIVKEIFGFLDVDDAFLPDMREKHNVNPPAEEPISPKAKKMLQDLYRDDLALAGNILGRDLSGWLA